MRHHAIVVFLLLLACHAVAQTRSGVISDDNTKLPLAGVTVYNRTNKELSTSEINGAYAIKADAGDTVIFTVHGYALEKRTGASLAVSGNIFLSPVLHQLEEVVIESPYLKYRRDSASERFIYHKTINDAAQKPKLESIGTGVSVNGVFTWLANGVSGRAKKYKRFVRGMQSDEQARYISIVYNLDKVIALTHATDSLAEQFIVHTPMPYDFARSASSLELSMWIREHFHEFTKPRTASARPMAE